MKDDKRSFGDTTGGEIFLGLLGIAILFTSLAMPFMIIAIFD